MATKTDTYQATHNNENLTAGGGNPLEKDFSNGNGYHLGGDMDSGEALKRIQTAGSISISPELFEKLYLSPQNKVSGDLRKTFANPTPIAIVGFLLCLTPLSCILMGWRGAGGSGASDTAVYFFFGGVLMLTGGFLEWVIGNTFPCVVFMSFGAFWLSFGGTLQPFYNAYGAYSTTGNPADGLTTVGFNASFAFFQLFMGLLCLVYLVCAIRTNICFVGIFLFLIPAFGCLAGAYWHLALQTTAAAATAGKLLVAGGACCFIVCAFGWWIFAAIMLASLDFPFQLPVGDLSRLVPGASDKAKTKEARYEA